LVVGVTMGLVVSLCAGLSGAGASANKGSGGPPRWSAPTKVPGVKGLFAVSCPTARFCVAVGHDDAVSYAKGHWSAPIPLGTDGTINGGLTAVSCTSTEFCMAGSGAGDTFTFDGTSWSALGTLSPTGLSQISCATPTFCGALDINGASYFYNGSQWSSAVTIPAASQSQWISCPVHGTCVAVDGTATDVNRYDNGKWSALGTIAPSTPTGGSEPDEPSAISCAGTRFCAALDNFGEAFTWHGGRWSGPTRFDANLLDGVDAVSCASPTSCMLVDDDGIAAAWNGSSWSKGSQIDGAPGSLTDVSCATATSCMAVDARGRAIRYG